jgi:hypothetical protein
MKKLIIIVVLALATTTLFAQEKTRQEKSTSSSKWQETKNGVSFNMEANATGITREDADKSFFSLNIKGNKALLTKITFVNKEKPDSTVNTAVLMDKQKIITALGSYTFSFYHAKLGKLDFEIQLKNEDVVIDLKI